VIRDARPHLVALQEVDSATRRTGGVDQAAMLGALTGLRPFFARAMAYDGGAYGVALLTALPASAQRAHPLPADSAHEPRVAAEARIALRRTGALITFLGTHLDHTADPAVRRTQVDRILQIVRADTAFLVLAGDLNATPIAAELASLLNRFLDAGALENAPTFPAPAPERRIDYVLLHPVRGFRVLETRVIEEASASDHRAVLAVVEVRGER
jgi:endonuclease/exonuclease/phosphatase family metal-dependent hydrolase